MAPRHQSEGPECTTTRPDNADDADNYDVDRNVNGRSSNASSKHAGLMNRQLTSPDESVLADILEENDVLWGGGSMGKGFRLAARHFLRSELAKISSDPTTAAMQHDNDDLSSEIIDDPFYVCDLGVVVSQFFQWKRHMPRVEPFYAVKCNPDPVIIKTLATLGSNFDCASRNEIILVEECSKHLPRRPDIIYANPCKARSHLKDAVKRGVTKVTFDNVAEVVKCAKISKDIQLVLRIITDDTGAQCRLSTKYGAPRCHWKELLQAAKFCGLDVVGVSFHVGSGCRDASRYDLALRDAREVFDMAKNEFGFANMHILDIGGGFPGETHSLWNPADLDVEELPDEDDILEEKEDEEEQKALRPFMFFADIADHISPALDDIFPEKHIRIIGEPGRYLVAASSTIVVAITSIRTNSMNRSILPVSVSDKTASKMIFDVSRNKENKVIKSQGATEHPLFDAIVEQIADYSQLFAKQQLAQQEVDVMVDTSSRGLLNMPENATDPNSIAHTVEGITARIVGDCMDNKTRPRSKSFDAVMPSLTLASAGEAAVSGVVKQAMVDSGANTDDFAYYVNDGVYGAFNNLMFDHANVRPRLLLNNPLKAATKQRLGDKNSSAPEKSDDDLYPSTIFGPTCDSIDVICRSVLLPKLEIGDWLYFENMGAYTSAAASTFNGFEPTKKFYVCSVLPEAL